MEQEALLEVVTKSHEPSLYWVAVQELKKLSSYGFRVYCFLILVTYISYLVAVKELKKLSSYGFRVYCFLIIVTYVNLSPLTAPQES